MGNMEVTGFGRKFSHVLEWKTIGKEMVLPQAVEKFSRVGQ